MILKEVTYNNKQLKRISARKVYNIINNKSKLKNDVIIYAIPCKMRHDTPWAGFFEIEVPKSNAYIDSIDIYNMINEILFYNCSKENGNYLKYYIES